MVGRLVRSVVIIGHSFGDSLSAAFFGDPLIGSLIGAHLDSFMDELAGDLTPLLTHRSSRSPLPIYSITQWGILWSTESSNRDVTHWATYRSVH